MTSLFDGIENILVAIWSADPFEVSMAIDHSAIYILMAIFILLFSFGLMKLLNKISLLDKYLEPTILVSTYLTIAGIIFVEVIRRFVFQEQAPWSTTLPPYLFLVMTWAGCTYNVKLRTHLAFSEFRLKMSRRGQMMCLSLDALLWFIFALIVIVTSFKQTINSAANFQVLLGTDNVMQWWFYSTVVINWLILTTRVLKNLIADFQRYRSDQPLIQQASIGGE